MVAASLADPIPRLEPLWFFSRTLGFLLPSGRAAVAGLPKAKVHETACLAIPIIRVFLARSILAESILLVDGLQKRGESLPARFGFFQ